MPCTRSLAAVATTVLLLGTASACTGAEQAAVGVVQALDLAGRSTSGYHSVRITAEMTSPQGVARMTGRIGWKPAAEDLTMTGPAALGGRSIRIIFVGGTEYMDTGSFGAAQAGGRHWQRMPGTISVNVDDPGSRLAALASAQAVTRVGVETVNGRQAVHYRGTLDDSGNGAGLTETVDVWVDAANLPVRIARAGTTSLGAFHSSVDYSDYSTAPLSPTPPPASDTFAA